MKISDLIEKLMMVQKERGNLPVVFTTEDPVYPENWTDGNIIKIDVHMSNDNDCHYECVIHV